MLNCSGWKKHGRQTLFIILYFSAVCPCLAYCTVHCHDFLNFFLVTLNNFDVFVNVAPALGGWTVMEVEVCYLLNNNKTVLNYVF